MVSKNHFTREKNNKMSKKKHEFLKKSPLKFKPVSMHLDTRECFVSGNTYFASCITVRGKGDKEAFFTLPYRYGYECQHEHDCTQLLFPNSDRSLYTIANELGIHLYVTKYTQEQDKVRAHVLRRPFYKEDE